MAEREPELVTAPEAEVPLGAEPSAAQEPDPAGEHVLEDLLVEEVSIDGMCGVY